MVGTAGAKGSETCSGRGYRTIKVGPSFGTKKTDNYEVQRMDNGSN
jgi:hypothetical protein